MRGERKYKKAVERLSFLAEEIKSHPFKGADAQRLSLNITGPALQAIKADIVMILEVGARAIKMTHTKGK